MDYYPAPPRQPRNWSLALLMVCCFAGLAGILAVTGIRDSRNAEAPPIPADGGAYAFAHTQADGKTPVGYDPCRPIEIEVNPAGAPDGWEELVRTAMDHVRAESGLNLTYAGTTDSRRFLDDGPDPGRGPSIVGWSTEREYDELAGEVAGVGGSTMVQLGGRARLTTGAVVLDIDAFDAMLDAGLPDQAQAVVDHEFGHLVGLQHVDVPSELMYRQNTGRTTWGPGDREGLARLGRIRCG